MKPKFSKKVDYRPEDVLDEIVRARLFDDYNNLDAYDEPQEMLEAYEMVLRYITKGTDKRLKLFDKKF
jgi:hypothetical protein